MSQLLSLKPLHKITTDEKNVYADKMKIGYHFQDGNGYFVNMVGGICKGFPDKNKAMLWIAGYAEKHLNNVRNYLAGQPPINAGGFNRLQALRFGREL